MFQTVWFWVWRRKLNVISMRFKFGLISNLHWSGVCYMLGQLLTVWITSVCCVLCSLSPGSNTSRHYLTTCSTLSLTHNIIKLIFNQLNDLINWLDLSFGNPDREFLLDRPGMMILCGELSLDLCRNLTSSWPDRSEIWSNNTIFNINHIRYTIPISRMINLTELRFFQNWLCNAEQKHSSFKLLTSFKFKFFLNSCLIWWGISTFSWQTLQEKCKHQLYTQYIQLYTNCPKFIFI